VKLKVNLGIFPELVDVSLSAKNAKISTLSRTGATTHAREVILKVEQTGATEDASILVRFGRYRSWPIADKYEDF